MKQPPKKGFEVLQDNGLNRSTAFTRAEREELGLKGLLPYKVNPQTRQIERVLRGLEREPSDIEKYILLSSLQDRNEDLFYSVVVDHIEQIMPLIYTPTVGQACKEFSDIFRRSKGFYITPEDKGQIGQILDNWPDRDIRVIVVTDGQRILGLGDLGANGMGIPVGKLALYVACAGIHPSQCLPVMLDVGTNNEEICEDELYVGYPFPRLEGDAYDELVEEFVVAVQEKFPQALIQFEDFLTPNAYKLLHRYRDRVLCFNDDIQGTAAVVLAGVYASTRLTGIPFSDLRVLFLGAGSAATGIGDLMVPAFEAEGLSNEEARKRLWFVDRKGLVVKERTDLAPHNLPYAQDHSPLSFVEAIETLKPHILIGATGAPGTFTKEVIERMAAINEKPVIFALSNPTSKAECTAEQAYTWSQGRAVFSSGSPFAPFEFEGKTHRTGQGNNAYVFPGLGLGAVCAQANTISDILFLVAARTLAEMVSEEDLKSGALYPRLTEIRRISLAIATAVAEKAYELDKARAPRPSNLQQAIAEYMYDPRY